MRPLAVFYHGLFWAGDPPTLRANAVEVVRSQMKRLEASGLLAHASEMVVGINGGRESESLVSMFIPAKARVMMHGLESKSENLTLLEMEKWTRAHPGWNVLYFHAKGSTHDPNGSNYERCSVRWRECMMRRCVDQWHYAASLLENGFEAVGCHWIAPNDQHYFAGNFYWTTSDFFATIPSMIHRARIKTSGISSLESRFEAEVILGNGPRLPRVKDLETGHHLWQCP